jgi:putative FmdB family regulatory protein
MILTTGKSIHIGSNKSRVPLYEYFCNDCSTSFEALVPLSASEQSAYSCPGCGAASRRILSTVNFATGRRMPTPSPALDRNGNPDVTSLTLPPMARLCWMDDPSAARLAAYKAGRGAEYDDTVSSRKELVLQRGENEKGKLSDSTDSHSPLSDPVVLSNRRNAAQKEKAIESAPFRKSGDGKS